MRKRKPWTAHDIDMVRRLYPDHLAQHIATLLGRTTVQIYNMANKLGLEKSKAFKSSPLSGRLDGMRGTSTRYKPGTVPPNKGTKGLTGANRTSFSKGNMPHNHKPVGSTRVDIDGYHWTKIAEPKTWAMTHRLIWADHFGPIPSGMAVKFKDNNKANLDPSNLELVNRPALMKQNTIHQYPPELVEVVKTLGRLKSKIQKHGKKQN